MHNTMSRQKTAICIAATALILSSLTTTTITANAQAPAFRNTHFSSGNELRPLTNRLPPVNEPPTIDPTYNSGLSNLGQAPVATSRQSEPTNISYEALKMYEIALRTAKGAQQFGLAAFHEVMAQTAEVPRDFMISPFAVWSLLLMLFQGSAGRTHAELAKTLNIDVTEEQLRSVFSQYQQALNIATPVVEVASLQAVFAERRFQINEEYKNAIRDYGGVLVPVDFQNRYTYQTINDQVAQATRNFIKQTVQPQDLVDANMYMFSSLFFKGKWKYPFNASLTRTETFYNEQNEPIGNVEMMVQENKFVFTGTVAGLNAYVLELPYGETDRLAMFIILPKRNVTLMEVANQLKTIGVSPILDKLSAAQQIAEGDVEVVMPKFNTSTDFKIKGVLQELGILEVFDRANSDLSRIGPKGLFVSDCVHTTKIIVDEQGTTAAAVASATLVNKTSPPKFNLNKPFLYLILDKTTQLLLFAGKIVNPAFRG